MRGLYSEELIYRGNLRFKFYWTSLKVGSKFTIFVLFYFVFEGNFPSTSPRGAYMWRRVFLHYRFGGLIFGGAYFRNFTLAFVGSTKNILERTSFHT